MRRHPRRAHRRPSRYTAAAILGSQAPDQSVAARLATHADRHGLTIVAVIDNDPAGRAWGRRLGDLLAGHGHDLTIVEPPVEGVHLNAWALGDPSWTEQVPEARRHETPSASLASGRRGFSSPEMGLHA